MAHFSIFTLPFRILKALLLILLTPIFHIISCLLSVFTRVARYFSKNKAPSLSLKTSQQPNDVLCNREKGKLLNAWSASTTSKVLFVTIEANLSNDKTSVISEIAVSGWSPDRSRIFEPSLWVVENNDLDATEHVSHGQDFWTEDNRHYRK
ncbi:hypothetical protein F5B22DRAFT_618820 [Xylaria bambusicola]|uniref:uncharacterized protein n=1 Tax=Xylaria bambusicola TaxID=326684 RepID=UPI0020082DCD|nr:uncharacterized protein F5B22DRAFT_618820 [Xylaria bambusicola]KAI0509006.1 hypothetical protein F5B22DRAFT_618820 [Xylaria bambusicola]